MQLVRTLRFLSLSTVIALGTALTLACNDEGPTATEQAPSLADGRAAYVDDDGSYYCPANYLLVSSPYNIYTGWSVYDVNQNGYFCEYHKGSGGGRPLRIDDDGNLNCKSGYTLTPVAPDDYDALYDSNKNGYMCLLLPKQ